MKSAPECPRCGRYSIVQESETRWTCLNCNFSKNLSHPSSRQGSRQGSRHEKSSDSEDENNGWFSIFILAGMLLIVMVEVVYSQDLEEQSRDPLPSAIALQHFS
jgi:hypothetical protein